jgi:hypothetical protein
MILASTLRQTVPHASLPTLRLSPALPLPPLARKLKHQHALPPFRTRASGASPFYPSLFAPVWIKYAPSMLPGPLITARNTHTTDSTPTPNQRSHTKATAHQPASSQAHERASSFGIPRHRLISEQCCSSSRSRTLSRFPSLTLSLSISIRIPTGSTTSSRTSRTTSRA